MRPLACTLLVAALLALPVAGAHGHAADNLSSADLPIPGLDFGPGPVGLDLRAMAAAAEPEPLPAPSLPAPGRFELVGHDPLFSRGMNAALAVHGRYAYVGSRTDGTHTNAGVLVVDVGDPAKPEVVHEIGRPDEANVGESSRELRILPDQQLLLVLNHGCSELIHRCANTANAGTTPVRSNIRFYDISGANAKQPKLVATYLPSRSAAQQPHEFYLWSDPARPSRVLLYETTPSNANGSRENLIVTDLSRARENVFTEVAKWTTTIDNPERDNRLHSLTVSNDGRKGYFAFLGGGFLVADFSDFADAKEKPEVRLVTPVQNRVFWTDPGAHSAAKLPGRDHVLVTDEVYGKLGGVLAEHGCPWGWVRFVDITRPEAPKIESEYKLPSNDPDICDTVGEDRDNLSSFSSHNPTLTKNLALITWHSAGLQAVDTADPTRPVPAAEFIPEPLPEVQTEDPALSSGRDKVVMWSFPVVKDGLVYVVDLRNGLYILRYRGPHEEEVSGAAFLDGNSNSGDVQKLEPVGAPAPPAPGATATPAPTPGGTPAPDPVPPSVVGDGKACLAQAKLRGRALGPFRLGMSRERVALRGGPAERSSRARWRYCVEGGAKLDVVLRGGRVALLLRREVRQPRFAQPGRRIARGLYLRRGKRSARVYVVRGGRVRSVGVVRRGASARTVRALVARTRG